MLTDRMFIHTKTFDKLWKSLGCDDDDLLELQRTICENPQGHSVIRGTGGVRKIRVSLEGRGKSGGARILYIDFLARGVVGLLYVYPKSEKEDIDENERKILKSMVEQLKEKWSEKNE